MISHQGVDRGVVLDAVRRRWPNVVVGGQAQEEPAVTMLPTDAADLGHHFCGATTRPARPR